MNSTSSPIAATIAEQPAMPVVAPSKSSMPKGQGGKGRSAEAPRASANKQPPSSLSKTAQKKLAKEKRKAQIALPPVPPVGGNGEKPSEASVPPKPQPPVRRIGFATASNQWAPQVVKGSKTDTYIKKLGFNLRYYSDDQQGGDVNPHLAQACERGIATAKALAYLYTRNAIKVLSVYGDARDERIVSYCNREAETPMDLQRYTPFITAKDGTRKPTQGTYVEAARDRDALLMVDIYATNVDGSCEFSPRTLSYFLEGLAQPFGPMKLMWIGRKFYGDVGVVAGEGAWRRTLKKNGQMKVIYRASTMEPTEYEHDPCDWIWQSSSAAVVVLGQAAVLSWNVAFVVGTTYGVVFHLTVGQLSGESSELFAYETNLIDVPVPRKDWFASTLRSYQHYVPFSLMGLSPCQTKLRLYKPVFDRAYTEVVNKRYSPTNLSLVTQTMILECQNPSTKLFLDAFPMYNPMAHLTDLAWGILMFKLEERHSTVNTAMQVGAGMMYEVNEAQAKLGAPPSSTQPATWGWAKLLGLAAGAVVLLLVARRLARRNPVMGSASLLPTLVNYIKRIPIPTNTIKWLSTPRGAVYHNFVRDSFLNLVVAPVCEEGIKRLMNWGGYGMTMPLIEFGSSILLEGRSITIRYLLLRIFVLYLHKRWLVLPFTQGVVAHFGWNLLCHICHEINGLYDPNSATFWKLRLISRAIERAGPASMAKVGYLFLLLLSFAAGAFFLRQRVLAKNTAYGLNYYAHWKKLYYETDWENRVVDQDAPRGNYVIIDPRVPESATSSIVANVAEGHLFKISGELFKIPFVEKPVTYFYHLLPTSFPGYVPQVNYQNLIVAIASRLLKPPPMTPTIQEANWKNVERRYGEDLINRWFEAVRHTYSPPWEDVIDAWVEHFKSSKKRRQYADIVRQLREGRLKMTTPTSTDVFLKHDELLLQAKWSKTRLDEALVHSMKPRLISNVHPTFQAKVGPYIQHAQDVMKDTLSNEQPPRTFLIRGKQFYIHLSCSGSGTDQELTTWMQNVISRKYCPIGCRGIAIKCSGDDSIVAEFYPTHMVFWEGDASMFDSSQSKGPLKFQYLMMHCLGVDASITLSLYKVAHATLVVRPKKNDYDFDILRVDRSQRPHRDTGGADTYIGNTLVMLAAWYFVVRSIWELQDDLDLGSLETNFSYLGFAMKFRTGKQTDVTFLKGMWYPTDSDGLVWGPLPSRVLKAGKSLSCPTDLYPNVGLVTASGFYLRDVASSYSTFLPVPILRAFVQRFAADVKPHPMTAIKEFSVQGTGLYRNCKITEDAVAQVCHRYDIDETDIAQVEYQYSVAEPLELISHSAFSALALVDYN